MSDTINLRDSPTYLEIVKNEFFDCITEKSNVLEIGPYHPHFSNLILQKNPKSLTLVEADEKNALELKKCFVDNSTVCVIHDCIFDYLRTVSTAQFDVVVIFGVIYHLASPFELLEQVVNKIEPKFVCIDNPDTEMPHIIMNNEAVNTPGARQSKNKTVGFCLSIPESFLEASMKNLGFTCLHRRYMAEFNVYSKTKTNITKFKNDI